MPQPSHPTYYQSLGAIGSYLDQQGYENVLICELADGFVVRALKGEGPPEAIPFQLSDLQDLIGRAIEEERKRRGKRAMVTTNLNSSSIRRGAGSYQAMLAAVGRQFDRLNATMVLVMELSETVLVTFRTVVTTGEAWDSATHEYLYDDAGMRTLLVAPT
jgi:hypothetical protein